MGEPPPPRLAHIRKWTHFDGYGFNLHAEKNKPGQYVGKIDANSPADAAGLKEGDRIVEVNGVNVNQENHKQVVQRIKAVLEETRLLVVDKRSDEWHSEQGVTVKASLPYTLHLSSETEVPEGPGLSSEEEEEVIDTRLQQVKVEESSPPSTPRTPPSVEREASIQSSSSASSAVVTSRHSVSSGSLRSTPSPSDSPDLGLNLNMTAKEMRERLGSQKKRDPRKDSNRHDMRKKFEMIEAL